MKKCKGCGIVLQNEDSKRIGYVVDMNQDYCQRCFRLTHYGDNSSLKLNFVTNSLIEEIYSKYKNDLFIVLVDALEAFCLDSDNLLEHFKDYNILLVINKTDILPKNIKDNKLDFIYNKIVKKVAKNYHICSCLLTNANDSSFHDVFFETLNNLGIKQAVIAGRANAGKSSFINHLLNNKDLTTSVYPGTTLNDVVIKYEDYTFIDTPGLIDDESAISYLSDTNYAKVVLNKTIKPLVYQLYEGQAYFYNDLFRIDIVPKHKSSVLFFVNEAIGIHRSNLKFADEYYKRNSSKLKISIKPKQELDYKVDDTITLLIKGLGIIKIKGECKAKLYISKNIKPYIIEVNL